MTLTGKQSMAPYALPRVTRLGKYRELTLVECRGDFDVRTWRQLGEIAGQLAGDPDTFVAVLVIASKAACWPHPAARRACEALLKLRREKLAFAFIETALGASYLAAACCGPIFATPAAQLGLLDVGDSGGNAAFAVAVQDARPLVRTEALEQLERTVISGEAAASKWARLADDVCPSIEHLLAALFTKKGEAQQ